MKHNNYINKKCTLAFVAGDQKDQRLGVNTKV